MRARVQRQSAIADSALGALERVLRDLAEEHG
jgi:hypothetical protein